MWVIESKGCLWMHDSTWKPSTFRWHEESMITHINDCQSLILRTWRWWVFFDRSTAEISKACKYWEMARIDVRSRTETSQADACFWRRILPRPYILFLKIEIERMSWWQSNLFEDALDRSKTSSCVNKAIGDASRPDAQHRSKVASQDA